MTKDQDKAKFKLKNIKVAEISLVDRAANKRRILVAKSEDEKGPIMTDNVNQKTKTKIQKELDQQETSEETATPDHESQATLRMLGDGLDKYTGLTEKVKDGGQVEKEEIDMIINGLNALAEKLVVAEEDSDNEGEALALEGKSEHEEEDDVEKGLPELMQAQEMLQSIISRTESASEDDPEDPELMRDQRALVSLLSGNSAEKQEDDENPSPETKAEGDSNTGDPKVEKDPKIPEVNQGDVEKEDIAKRDELQKNLDSEIAKREDLEKRLTDMQDAQTLRETEEYVAKNYSNLPGVTAEFAKVLKSIRTLEAAPELEKVLATANEAIAKGDLFKEIVPQTGDNSGSAYDKATGMAKEICKNESGVTREKAMSRVWKENPELLNEYRAESTH